MGSGHPEGGGRIDSEERFRALVEQLPAVVYIDSNDLLPETLYVGPQVTWLLGHTPEEWMADPQLWPRSIHPEDRELVLGAWERSVRTGSEFHLEYRFLHPDGRTVWVSDGVVPVRDETDDVRFWRGVIQDITQFKRAEEDLRQSEARHRALVENIPAVIYEMRPDDERRTVYVSPHVERVLGYSRREWLDQPDIWVELLHPDDRETELAAHDLHNQTGEPWSREYRLVAEDGRFVWVHDRALLIRDAEGDPLFWQGVMLDVTEEKELEEQLRRANDELEFRVLARTTELAEANEMMSLEIGERRRVERQLRDAEERYRQLVENVPAAVYVWEISSPEHDDPPRAYMSPQIEQLLGYSPQEWIGGVLWKERLHPHDRERMFAAAERSQATGEPFQEEYRYLARDGRVVWVLDQARLIARDRYGQPQLYQGVMLDITARKEAEAKAAEAEARFRLLAEQGPVIAYLQEREETPEPHFVSRYVSPQIEQMLGYPIDRFLQDPTFWREIVHPDDKASVDELTERVMRGLEGWALEYRVLDAAGRVVWLHNEGKVLSFDAQGAPTGFHGVLIDVTQRRDAEEQLRETEARFRSLVEGVPAIPWTEVVDPETGRGRITYIGPQTERVLGYRPEELLDEPDHFERMLHPEDRERVMARSALADESGETWNEIFRVIARDGRVVWFHSRAEMVNERSGRQVWQGVSIDITAEVEAGTRLLPPISSTTPADG